MRILKGMRALRRAPRRAAVTVGVFDGMHRAHQTLIRTTVREARRLRGHALAVTFDPDPQRVLHPERAPCALAPLSARLAQLRALGVDDVWVIPFTRAFARTHAKTFVTRTLIERLRARVLVVGETFLFGFHRLGDVGVLSRLGGLHGMRVIAVKPIRDRGRPISSTRIRRALAAGTLAEAARLLGRPPGLWGRVVRGAGRGRRLGIPTANIALTAQQCLPPQGVYAVWVHARGRRYRGAMNFGRRPTFGRGPVVCEVHLLKFSGRLPRQDIQLDLIARLRGERRFASPEALVAQVRRDLARARRLLGSPPS